MPQNRSDASQHHTAQIEQTKKWLLNDIETTGQPIAFLGKKKQKIDADNG